MDVLEDSHIFEIKKLLDNIILQAILIYQNFIESDAVNLNEFINKSNNFLETSEYLSPLPGNDSELAKTSVSTSLIDDLEDEDAPLNIEWCFGINSNTPVQYFDSNLIAYSASHMVVIFNMDTKTMKFLKGFTNEIIDISSAKGLIAAADSGLKDFSIILWNMADLTPKQFFINPQQGGISLIKLSPCGEYITAVSAIIPPTLSRWQINGSNVSNRIIPIKFPPKHLTINPNNTKQHAITFSQTVVIINFENVINDIVNLEVPKTSGQLGCYRMSMFLDNSKDQLLTATNQGMVIVWKCTGKYIKSVQIHTVGLTWFQIVDDMLVIACEDGSLWLYEQNLCMRNWYRLDSNSIRCMTFTSNGNPSLRDFAYLTSSHLGIVSNSRKIKQTMEYNSAFIVSMEVNAPNSKLLTGDSQGYVSIYDLSSKTLKLKQSLFDCAINVLTYSTKYTVLAAGSEYGDILILDSIICSIKHRLKSTRYSIYKIHLSEDGTTLAYTHKRFGTGLFKFTIGWHFRGKYRAHQDQIVDSTLVGNRLFTIGKDRIISEFDVNHVLRYVTQFRIEERAIPTSCVWANNLLLVANNEHRIRFVDVENKEIIKTIRSPGMYHLHKMVFIDDKLIYATGKDLGVCKFPWEAWGSSIQVHATKIINFCVFQNNVLTCAQSDRVVFMWSINKTLPTCLPSIPNDLCKEIKKKCDGGTIKKCDLIESLREMGFFLTEFDAMNILREYPFDNFDCDMLSTIIFHHGPPPGIRTDEIEKLFIKSCDAMRASDPVIQTDTLISLLQTGSNSMTQHEAYRNLTILTSPALMPPVINFQSFLTDIVGIEKSKLDNRKEN